MMKHRPSLPVCFRGAIGRVNKNILAKNIRDYNSFDLAKIINGKRIRQIEPVIRTGETEFRKQQMQQTSWRSIYFSKVCLAVFHHPEPRIWHSLETNKRWNKR